MKAKHLFPFRGKRTNSQRKRSKMTETENNCSKASVSASDEMQSVKEKYEVIRDFLEAEGYVFEELFGVDAHLFRFCHITDDGALQFPMVIEADTTKQPCVCIVTAYYPFYIDSDFLYPLCKIIASLNCETTIGGIQYSHDDDDLYYRYSFPANQLHKDTLSFVLNEVVRCVESTYEIIGRYTKGEYTPDEHNVVVNHTQKLLNELGVKNS